MTMAEKHKRSAITLKYYIFYCGTDNSKKTPKISSIKLSNREIKKIKTLQIFDNTIIMYIKRLLHRQCHQYDIYVTGMCGTDLLVDKA